MYILCIYDVYTCVTGVQRCINVYKGVYKGYNIIGFTYVIDAFLTVRVVECNYLRLVLCQLAV